MLDIDDRVRVYELHSGVLAGMTKRPLGNFSPEEPKRLDPVLAIHQALGKNPPKSRFVMRAEGLRHEVFAWSGQGRMTQHCDGAIWKGPGITVFFPGGCGAVAFHDPAKQLSGLLHTGWPGVGGLVVQTFLDTWKSFGGDPGTTIIRFLPAICGKCLTFDLEYWENRVLPSVSRVGLPPVEFLSGIGNKVGFHLMPFVAELLRRANYVQIEDRFICTCHSRTGCGSHIFRCYRCDDREGRPKNRNAAFLSVEPLPHLA